MSEQASGPTSIGEPPAGEPTSTDGPPASEPASTDEQAPARPAQPRTTATGFPGLQTDTVEQFGRPVRRFPVAVSAEAMALAWANQEDAPQGATVVVEHEIRAGGLHGRLWEVPATDSLACSVVLRPTIPPEDADSAWLVAALASAEGAQAVSGRELSTWWPDSVVDASREQVAAVRAEVQLGPGRVKSIVITLRFNLPRLGIEASRKDELLEAVVHAVDAAADELSSGAVGAAYEKRCALLGNRVMIRLLPKGETRGTARRVDRGARLQLESASGLTEKITVDQVRDMKVI